MTTIPTPAVLSSAVTTNAPNRRAMLIGVAAVPFIACAAPAIAGHSTFMPVYDRFMAAWYDLNNAPSSTSLDDEEILSDRYLEALHALIAAHPGNDREFRLKFIALWDDGGSPRQDIILRVLDDAKRIGGAA